MFPEYKHTSLLINPLLSPDFLVYFLNLDEARLEQAFHESSFSDKAKSFDEFKEFHKDVNNILLALATKPSEAVGYANKIISKLTLSLDIDHARLVVSTKFINKEDEGNILLSWGAQLIFHFLSNHDWWHKIWRCPACKKWFVRRRRDHVYCKYECRMKVNYLKRKEINNV
jgi:hypothetical protein